MADQSKDRMRRKRLRDAGFEGKPAPVSQEKIVQGLSKEEAEDVKAWAEGVWRRQGQQAERQRRGKYEDLRDSLVERGVKNVPVSFEVDSEARAERARKYAAWREGYLAGKSE